jgi:single-strand DNA-binding protein
MANLNKIVLLGKVVYDPQKAFGGESNPLLKFILEVERPRNADGLIGKDYVNIVAWGKLAESNFSSLAKGKVVLVEGRISERSFTTAEGVKRWVTEVIAHRIQVIEISSSVLENVGEKPEENIDFPVEDIVLGKNDFSTEQEEVPF